MKHGRLKWIAASTLALLFAVLAIETPLAAQGPSAKQSRYRVIDLGTFGGPHSGVNGDSVNTNAKGTVVGGASTSIPDSICSFDYPFCFAYHAFKYQRHALIDLGTLPGGTNSFAIAINSAGAVAGISENGLVDPVTGVSVFVATTWKGGQIIDLGTFGGSFSLPNDINSRGEAAGGAENTIPDPFDFGGNTLGLPSPTQWHATLWQQGSMRDLGTLGNGPDSFALFVNEAGQAAGFSFTDSIVNPETGIPTVDPFFWENGKMVDLGSLGGVFGTVGALNNRGQITGTSDVTRDRNVQHAFLSERGGRIQDLGTFGGDFSFGNWIDDSGEVVGGATTKDNAVFRAARWKDGRMTNLGSLNNDICSFANSSNSRGQIVGNSIADCDNASRAFLSENGGPMVDLNSLIPPNSGFLLKESNYINEAGEIAGLGVLANGDEHAFLLIPNNDDGTETATAASQASAASVTPSPTEMSHSSLTSEKLAALRARFAQRHRSFGLRSAN
jgi:probable HAF family extracellular repeat protein